MRIRADARDAATGVVGIDEVVAVTEAVRGAVREVVAAGARPLVLGGCCGLVPGALAGLRDAAGTIGVAYLDGHVDVYDGHTSPTGEAADMPMGVAFGLGPDPWVAAAGGAASRRPTSSCSAPATPRRRRTSRRSWRTGCRRSRCSGPRRCARRARGRGRARAARLAAGPGRFWIHLDVDVLDERAMPATDYLMPGGLEWDELAALLGPLGASPALAGLSLGCLNPEKDPDGTRVARTGELLAGALGA